MLDRTSSTAGCGVDVVHPDVEALHRRCGIYTRPELVDEILDAVGWRDDVDLSASRLLEPSAGNGIFVANAGRRLVRSLLSRRLPPSFDRLAPCIRAFELHPGETVAARMNVADGLMGEGVSTEAAHAVAHAWITNGDFLLAETRGGFTHVVGNPPYVRWSKVPVALRRTYAAHLPREMVGGDLFIPFLDRALDLLAGDGRCGFVCSDRWRFMAFAEGFRRKWLPRLEFQSNRIVNAVDAFVGRVDVYATVFTARKREVTHVVPAAPAVARGATTLRGAGYTVRVGPALGHAPAFVLEPHEGGVEVELLCPWLSASEVGEGTICWKGRRIVAMSGVDGVLIDPRRYPGLSSRLSAHRATLERRSIVRAGAPWFRTIDRVRAVDWARPKLLVPELAKVPRIALDLSGAIPSHGVYAIFAPDDELGELLDRLAGGGLAAALDGIAPRIKGGYVRCYRRFLEAMTIPSGSYTPRLRTDGPCGASPSPEVRDDGGG